MERFGHGAELLAVACGLGRRDAEAVRRGDSREPEQPDRDRCRGEGAGCPGHVPACVVVLRVEGIAGAGGELVPEGVRGQQVDAAAATPLRQRRARGVQRRGGMQNGRDMGVVEIQCMASDSVHKRGVGDSQAVERAERPGLRLPAEHKALLPGDASGRLRGARDGQAQVIEQAPGALVQHLGGHLVGLRTRNEVEQCPRLGGSPIVVVFSHVVCITEFLSVLQTGAGR